MLEHKSEPFRTAHQMFQRAASQIGHDNVWHCLVTGNCSSTHIPVAFVLDYLIRSRRLRLSFRSKWVKAVDVVSVYVTTAYVPLVRAYPMTAHRIPKADAWKPEDIDFNNGRRHQLLRFTMTDGEMYTVDFTAAQFDRPCWPGFIPASFSSSSSSEIKDSKHHDIPLLPIALAQIGAKCVSLVSSSSLAPTSASSSSSSPSSSSSSSSSSCSKDLVPYFWGGTRNQRDGDLYGNSPRLWMANMYSESATENTSAAAVSFLHALAKHFGIEPKTLVATIPTILH